MKKYFMTVATIALFAIGFAASDEDESSNSSFSSESQTEQKQESDAERQAREQKEEEKYFQPGNSYISNAIDEDNNGSVYQYEISMYNDGTFELKEIIRYDGNEDVYEHEGKWEKNTESRKDITRTWYDINSDHAKNNYKHGTHILIDENGKIYYFMGRSAHEAVGGESVGSFRKK